jgi:hypothetical protein
MVAMREAWISAPLVAALALAADPLSAQQRARPTGAHVVACSGIFAKDSDHLKLTAAFDSKNVTFTDVEAVGDSKVPASVLFPNDPKSPGKLKHPNLLTNRSKICAPLSRAAAKHLTS